MGNRIRRAKGDRAVVLRAVPKTKPLIHLASVSGGNAHEGGSGAITKLRADEWYPTDDYSSGENQPSSTGWSFRHGS
jgi:hypothetical protein